MAECKREYLFHSNINWTKMYSSPFKIRIITTNIFLTLKINKAKISLCTFCKSSPGNIIPLIWECIHLKIFLNALVQYLLDNYSDIHNLFVAENNKTIDDTFKQSFTLYKCKIIDTGLYM